MAGPSHGAREGCVLRGADRRPQAALDGCGVGVVREEVARSFAVGGGYCRVPRCVKEARQDQADWEVVGPYNTWLPHALSLDEFPQGPRHEGLIDQGGVHPVPGRVECGGHVIRPYRRGPPEAAGLQPERKCSLAGLVVASM